MFDQLPTLFGFKPQKYSVKVPAICPNHERLEVTSEEELKPSQLTEYRYKEAQKTYGGIPQRWLVVAECELKSMRKVGLRDFWAALVTGNLTNHHDM